MKVPFILQLLCLCLWLTTASAQDIITNNSNLEPHKLFGAIEFGIPENIKRIETNKELVEEMGFAYFSTADKKIEITIRKKDKVDLAEVKSLTDDFSASLYKGTIVRSELVKVNDLEFFLTDIKGQWNGSGDVIGMFRYYFNVKGDSYSLLMKYPVDLVDATQALKDKMLQSIKVIR